MVLFRPENVVILASQFILERVSEATFHWDASVRVSHGQRGDASLDLAVERGLTVMPATQKLAACHSERSEESQLAREMLHWRLDVTRFG